MAYHEGLPGHHMQIAIAQELQGIPTFRRQGGSTAYSEGWGLYAEWLAREMPGTYQDPYSRFGRLGSEIWRAIRLVVDTGLHAKGWSEEQAVQYFLANSATTEPQAVIRGLERLRMPAQLVQIMGFMVRYLDVVTDEMRRMRVALASRGFTARNPLHWPVIARSAGALFIRSYERGERVHLAMLSRGGSS